MSAVRHRGDVVTCSTDVDRWVVGVCPVDSDVSTGSESRGVVSGGDSVEQGPNRTQNIVPFRVIYHEIVWLPGEIERDTRVTQICAGTTAVKRSSSWIKGYRMNGADQEPSQKELTSFISNQIPEN